MRFSFPTTKQVRKWALWLLGAIAVKILATSLSDSFVMPALHTVSRWVLDLASLGLASYKNGVYQRIAADDQSVAAFDAYLLVWVVYALMMSAYAIFSFNWIFTYRRQVEHALKALSDGPPSPEPEISREAVRQRLRGVLKSQRTLRSFLYVFSICMGVILVGDVISLTRLSYVYSADAHYHQVMRVVSPYLDMHEQTEAGSDFAQIASREDYVRLLSRLEGQCKAHGKTVPKFDPW